MRLINITIGFYKSCYRHFRIINYSFVFNKKLIWEMLWYHFIYSNRWWKNINHSNISISTIQLAITHIVLWIAAFHQHLNIKIMVVPTEKTLIKIEIYEFTFFVGENYQKGKINLSYFRSILHSTYYCERSSNTFNIHYHTNGILSLCYGIFVLFTYLYSSLFSFYSIWPKYFLKQTLNYGVQTNIHLQYYI